MIPPRREAVRRQEKPKVVTDGKLTSVLRQSGFMAPVLKITERKMSLCKEGSIFYPLPKIRLIVNAADHRDRAAWDICF